jgi:signal transduction histidine kinase
MTRPRSDQTLDLWFIPALLVCVLVLSGLCVLLVRRQAGSEQNRLREQERVNLDRAQQEFRQRIEQRWETAIKSLPADTASHSALQRWDEQLEPDFFGFWLDDSGVFVYPNYRIGQQPAELHANLRSALRRLFPARGSPGSQASLNAPATNQENSVGQRLALTEHGDALRALAVATETLAHSQPGSDASRLLSASVVALETEEISDRTLSRQAALVDAWIDAFRQGWLSVSPDLLPWLQRMREQCRRRNERERWLDREHWFSREVRRLQWAEKFLPRLNLQLRRQLYNPARLDSPFPLVDDSDPLDGPFLVLCKFEAVPAFRLTGIVADLVSLCRTLETSFEQAAWRSPELLVHIRRTFPTSQAPADSDASSLSEQRILDPWAAQFTIAAEPRDANAFRRRAWQKNLLYLTLTGLTIGACVLVLFVGSRALKEQQRLSKLRSDFLANVSHELRTPLTAMRLHAEALERQLARLGSPVAASVETIVGEVDRLSVLINDVLEFTRLENDKKRFTWESVDLVPVLQESMQLFSQQLADGGFEVTLDLPESLVLRRADRAALKQCAANLIGNCVKFSPDHKSIFVRLRGEKGQAVWETEDRGIGVLPEDRSRIFDKFYRSASLDPAMSGTGLGLALCKAFVEAHGGSIDWEATATGQGSRFVIRLPV